MKFTTGQIYFAIFFIIVFVIAMIWSYKKDENHRKIHYHNTGIVGLVIALVIAVFAILVFWIHD